MNVLSFNELEEKINMFIDRSLNVSFEFNQYLVLLKNTGFRPNEALEFNNVVSHNNDHLIFQPNKRNNVRTIYLNSIPILFLHYYLNHSATYKNNKYRNYSRMFEERVLDRKYYANNKRCSLYLFRYYYIRNLYANGMELNEIQTKMGWVNEFLPTKYIFRPITY